MFVINIIKERELKFIFGEKKKKMYLSIVIFGLDSSLLYFGPILSNEI